MRVIAVRQEGFKWAQHEGVHVKGYLFEDGHFYRGEELAIRIAAFESLAAFEKFILTVNGSFALLINRANLSVAAVDRLRSIPLFYARDADTWIVGDDAGEVSKAAGLPARNDTRSLQEFALSGFVLGAATLISGLYQIRAGERVIFDGDAPQESYYYIHVGTTRIPEDETAEFDRLDSISTNWGTRLVQSAESRPLVLPLSGGYDSRYIAAVLRQLKYPSLVAYTYGRPNSPEVARSEKVARQLDIPWYFVEYTDEAYRSFLASESHKRYCAFAHQHSSLPHYQEFLALQGLINRGVIDSDSIIVPGFCGDLLGGSYVPQEVPLGHGDALLAKGIVRHIDEQQLYLKPFLRDRCSKQVLEHLESELAGIAPPPPLMCRILCRRMMPSSQSIRSPNT
ncbi:asparagine synthase-related protein [Candidatus Bipolaricaulota bacterium]